MLYAGRNIAAAEEKLLKVTPDYVYNSVRNPKPEIASMINRLRIIRSIDPEKYSRYKRELPYLICAAFNPQIRKSDYFVYTDYFIVEIDQISHNNLTINDLKYRIQRDARVFMLFKSPGEDGLKIMFRLAQRCFDAGLYSVFYKRFVIEFSSKYKLDSVIVRNAYDVCRPCFISNDSEAYFNPNSQKVDIESYVNLNDSASLLDDIKELRRSYKDNLLSDNRDDKKPDEDALARIRSLLQISPPAKSKFKSYIPEQLNDITEDLKAYLETTGLIVNDIRSISYGKKLTVSLSGKVAQINLFYGKNGYSVIKSLGYGINKDLNDIVSDLIRSYLAQI